MARSSVFCGGNYTGCLGFWGFKGLGKKLAIALATLVATSFLRFFVERSSCLNTAKCNYLIIEWLGHPDTPNAGTTEAEDP